MNPTICALAETILWTSIDLNNEPLDKNYTTEDVNEDCLSRLYSEFLVFLDTVETKITEAIGSKWNSVDEFYNILQPAENQTEHDFILTRNRHGAGFWDGDWMEEVSGILTDAARQFPEIEPILGDDGKIYLY